MFNDALTFAQTMKIPPGIVKDKNNKPNDEVIICTDETGMQLYLSEKAANRLSWILTGVMILISLPVIILAFMTI